MRQTERIIISGEIDVNKTTVKKRFGGIRH